MSTVDKKLMDQMFRLTKSTIASVSEKRECDGAPGRADRQGIMRTIVERGMRSLPLEQRVLLESERERQALEVGRSQILRLLGTWGVMAPDALCAELSSVDVPALLDSLEQEGIVARALDTLFGEEREVVFLTDEGKRQFAAQERMWDESAGSLFKELNEYEKMHLYLLLRKVVGVPMAEAGRVA